jgi:ADP-ribose pyrophosphatase YjhB (NUDIX family)
MPVEPAETQLNAPPLLHPWLEWIKQIHAMARWGLTYAKDPYDLERYEVLLKLSVEMMADFAQMDKTRIEDLFANEVGYLTPKVDVRGVVFQDSKLLMVQEKWDGRWTIPGGWADIGLSPAEVAVKEVQEEAGLEVRPVKMLALLDKKFYAHPHSPYHIYKVFIKCEITGGMISTGLESQSVGFFGHGELPELSTQRITREQIAMLFEHHCNPSRPTDFN